MDINFTMITNLGIEKIYGNPAARVEKVNFDSRQVKPHTAFICIQGQRFDGHSFIEKALEQGASVIIGSDEVCLKSHFQKWKNRTFVIVANAKVASAHLSALIYGRCDEKLKTVAVTGTNGKTTVTGYVKSLLNLLGMPAGSIGTLGITSSKGKIDFQKSTPTTPEAPDLHYLFRYLHAAGDEAVAMEVSSIAIEEKRVEGIMFDVGIHTNLSPEHLEYHHDFPSYKKAKLKMFDQVKKAVLNLDDEEMGKELYENFQGSALTYSLKGDAKADLTADKIRSTSMGSDFTLKAEGNFYPVSVPIMGNYNLANLLAAIGAAMHLGFAPEQIVRVLAKIKSPEGRFQLLKLDTKRTIILDYAHTPVALGNLLREVKKIPHRKLIVLIAGIGIRDFSKMPRMAATVENQADEIIVSVDHPGFHNPKDIVNQVITGFSRQQAAKVHQTMSRREGVETCLSLSEEGDIILLTSGCINGCQIVKDQYIPHSDEDIIEEYFSRSTVRLALKKNLSIKQET